MKTYTFHINGYDLAFFGAIFTGLTFVLLLWFGKGANRAANRFLAGAILAVVLSLTQILGKDTGLSTYMSYWSWLPLHFSLAIGPLIYFYVLKITRPDYKFLKKDLLHFSPLLPGLLLYVLEVSGYVKSGLANYQMPSFQLLSYVSVIAYLYLAYRQIGNFYSLQKFAGGDRYRQELRWLLNLLKSFGLLWLLCLPLIACDYFYHQQHLSACFYYPLYLVLALMTICMAATAFLRQEIGAPADTSSFLKPALPAELKQRAAWLKKAMKSGLYYQDPELSLSSLAEKLKLTTHELSRIMNTVLKKSFNDFINEYRVADVVQKMQDPAYSHITLLGIAFESGFNSQSSFNRIFKQLTGKSPLEYKNELKKEYPTYKMGSQSRFARVILHRDSAPGWYREKLTSVYMFKNYLKIAWRNLRRNKSYAAINVIGLAVGIAVCMMIFIIIQFQTSFDNFHTKKDRIYRVLTEFHNTDAASIFYGKDVPQPLPRGLKTAFPELEQVAPIFASHDDDLLIPDEHGSPGKIFKEQKGVFFTEPSFFKIFDFPLLAGSYNSLKDPNNVLLTKEIAEKYFGDWKLAIGKTIKLKAGGYIFEHGTEVLKVSGIIASIPANTDFQLKLVVAYGTGFTGSIIAKSTNWEDKTAADFGCYVLLPTNMQADDFNQQLGAYSQKAEAPGDKDSHIIQSISAVHYDTQVGNYSNKTISRQLLNVLWLIAAFILLIACVNFINLSTAQAVNRAKEVGVRKVLGSSKAQLQIQFIIETFLIVIAAVSFATIITILAMPYVNQLLELSLSFNIFKSPAIIFFLLIVTVTVTALAGFYPASALSRFNPVNALKNKLSLGTNGISLRRGLVVFQFIIAQALIIGTLIIVQQMNYFMDQPLGFDKDAIVNIPFRVDSLRIARLDYLKKQLLLVSGVQAVSYSSNTPVEDGNDMASPLRFNHATKETDFKAITRFADPGYVPTYKLQLIAGRNLQASNMTREFLVNESLMKSLGIKNPDDILNKEISIWNDQIKCPVVGVIKDFNDRSFRQDLAPLIISTNNTMYNQAGIKLETKNIASTMLVVKKIFDQTFPDFVYEYKFLDEKIAGFYKQENQLAALYKIFAAIAILLSCLGLYGLASFMAVQRIREVGIRKVLGASAGSIVYLFSKEFIILIALAFTIATPIAWYYMHQWLQAYVYRINISWWIFAAGGFAAIIIALATISFQAIKAAMTNPVKSLRSD